MIQKQDSLMHIIDILGIADDHDDVPITPYLREYDLKGFQDLPNIEPESSFEFKADSLIPEFYQRYGVRRCKCGNESHSSRFEDGPFAAQDGWLQAEDVLLTAAVMKRFFTFHSLTATKHERSVAKRKGESQQKIGWRKVRHIFLLFSQRFTKLTGAKFPGRTSADLEARWKQKTHAESSISRGFMGEKMWLSFTEDYNQSNVLTGSSDDLQKILEELRFTCDECTSETSDSDA